MKTTYGKKCDEGKSTSLGRLTESLCMLKEDRRTAQEHGSGAAWLSAMSGYAGFARYSIGYYWIPEKRFRACPG